MWSDGLSSEYTTVYIEFTYWHSKKDDPTMKVNTNSYTNSLELRILPLSKLVATCVAENKMTVTGSVSNQSYTIGAAAITITPPTFALTAPTSTTYSNTAFPINVLQQYTKLEYKPSGSTSWYEMPTSPSAATFASTKNDASCFPTIND